MDSNHGPPRYKLGALTAELHPHTIKMFSLALGLSYRAEALAKKRYEVWYIDYTSLTR